MRTFPGEFGNWGKTQSASLNGALKLPSGARFYRCALQVNPFAYLGRYGKQTAFQDEDSYNAAIVAACKANDVEAIAVTDHYRVAESKGLIAAARAAEIFVFGGFEASSKDGVDFLCIYDPERENSLERFIGKFGIHDHAHPSPNGDKDCLELLACVRDQGGIAIAANVAADNGLLKTLDGQPRANAWKSLHLYACAIPGSLDDVPWNYQMILKNKNADYKRNLSVALINASDVNSPEDLSKQRSTSFIKMSHLSVEGLRQAFLDPESRIRLNHDTPPEPHTEFIAMAWDGGFLDGTKLHFNENLNVLVGGRGAGKSTVIESIRYVLAIEPLGDEASKAHQGVEKLTLILERFVERDPNANARKAKLRFDLERSRGRITDVQREMKLVEEHLSQLPGLEETEKRFQDAGLEERLKEKNLLMREERILAAIRERLAPLSTARQEMAELLPVDSAFLSAKALEGLPSVALLTEGAGILDRVTAQLQKIAGEIERILTQADTEVSGLYARWDKRKQEVESTYEVLLRELQKDNIDGEAFIRLRKQIEELRPLREKKANLTRDIEAYLAERRRLIDEWTDLLSAEHRALEKAAKKITKRLPGRVRVTVAMGGNREPLVALLRAELSGKPAALLERLKNCENLSLLELAQRCREGKDALVAWYAFTPAAAERLAQATPDTLMKIEELELPATTKVELNTASEAEPEAWRALEALSTGQKATAVLLLLLLESEAPLIVDQPEDDLDNRFITDGVVPIMKNEKRKRQFIFSTHNANIPVLGDAELILGLSTDIQNGAVQGRISDCHMGSIDVQSVREMVEEILEGGKPAFEMRRLKYGF